MDIKTIKTSNIYNYLIDICFEKYFCKLNFALLVFGDENNENKKVLNVRRDSNASA